ncbi:MAG: aspartate aminotransferase family protein [Gammaproteobacteria bacterium]|jgi:beta-alanine--pyruvate transaminase|nr:aspartate aminotransferase family protein [Gammaproteobacteria bacterium]|tara:strand:- start:2603 stop:3934 length:1332 start_codon:yes stop_codon:yes gene_type:complete
MEGDVSTRQSDLEAYWMPYTSNREFKKRPRMIVEAEGCYFTDADGRRIFDGLSGLWTCGAGHNRPEIREAIANQLSRLDYAPAFQFGHPGAFQLADRIVEVMPAGLDHVFFTNSGSESADTATKIARAYWRQSGRPTKTRIIGRAKGYHGASWGGISFGGIGANRKLWGQGMEADHLPHTLLPENAFSRGQPDHGAHLAEALEDLVALHDASNIAAVIVEPLAGSAGVLPPPKGYLGRLREICDKHEILLIFDEVITAFGRMGAWTGAEAFGAIPDIAGMAKQLTNGVIPMGAVALRGEIYRAVVESGGPEHLIELPHGYTYSGHPVACAAGLASLELLERDGLIERSREMAPVFEDALHSLKGANRYITDIRNYGLAGALTIEPADGDPALRPYQIAIKCWEKGFFVRHGGDTVQLGLPFIVEREQIDAVVNAIGEAIDELD